MSLENDGDESDLTNTLMKVRTQPTGGQMRAPPKEKKTKDDAYAVQRQYLLLFEYHFQTLSFQDFMKEMQDLL